MTHKEFIDGFRDRREKRYREMVAAGQMRMSEAAMGLVDVKKDAAKLWRKHRKSYLGMTVAELFQ